MHFEIIGRIADVETIAAGPRVKIRALLRKRNGGQRWRKLKGVASVRLWDGTIRLAEVTGSKRTELEREKCESSVF
jgi:hypothetical protein